jgi:ELWxxDGT repeat protein/VCBS repeat-containing protein
MRLIFAADDGRSGKELWQTDGTVAGTQILQDIAPGARSSNPAELRVVGSTLVFAANDGTSGTELWAAPIANMNYAPVAVGAAVRTHMNTPVQGTLGAADPDNQPLTFEIVTNGSLGVVTITDATTGSFTYTPNAGATGADSFTFRVSDGMTFSNVATVTVAIEQSTAERLFVYLPLIR